MRLKVNKSKNSINYYIITDIKTKQGKRSTKVFKKLGNEQEIFKISDGLSPLELAKKQLEIVNKQLEEKNLKIAAEFVQSNIIDQDKQLIFNCGYLFLQDIYYSLGLEKICKDISDKYRIKYDLNSVLSNLIYTRIIEPSSKLSAFETAKSFLEQPNYELQNIYRALEIISKETENIEATVYKNSLKVVNRNTKILYYDCTNYFFEIEEAEGIKQYGKNIEESFRILKSDFKARPVYLKRDDRIKAHFTTCFLALLIYRILEHKLQDKYTSCEIIQTLRNMNLRELEGIGYIPAYTRTSLTDDLHKIFKFRTDYEISTLKDMKKIFYSTKKK